MLVLEEDVKKSISFPYLPCRNSEAKMTLWIFIYNI